MWARGCEQETMMRRVWQNLCKNIDRNGDCGQCGCAVSGVAAAPSLCDGCKLLLCFCMCRQEVWLLICSDTTVTVRPCSVVLAFWGDSWLRAGQTCRMVDCHWNLLFSLLYQISKLKALWRHSTCWFLVAYSTSVRAVRFGHCVLCISDIVRLLFLHRSNHEGALFWSFPLPFALHFCLEVSNWTQDLCLQRAEIWLCESIKRETDALSQTGNTHFIMYFIYIFFSCCRYEWIIGRTGTGAVFMTRPMTFFLCAHVSVQVLTRCDISLLQHVVDPNGQAIEKLLSVLNR